MKYETKQKLETAFFFGVVGLSIMSMVTLVLHGTSWANEIATIIVGL